MRSSTCTGDYGGSKSLLSDQKRTEADQLRLDKEHIEAHFLTCFVALTIARILENKLSKIQRWKDPGLPVKSRMQSGPAKTTIF